MTIVSPTLANFGSGVLSLVDAGHTPALIAEGARVNEVAGLPKGPAFGVVPGFAYEAAHVPLTPESTLVLFTDGVTDALDAKGNEFGPRRLYEALGGVTGRQAGDVVAAVIGAVDAFVANAPPEDDLTVLALRYSPA